MNITKIIAILFTAAQNAIALAQSLRAESGKTDDQLRADVASENQETRDSIDAFLASLKTGG